MLVNGYPIEWNMNWYIPLQVVMVLAASSLGALVLALPPLRVAFH